jgi:hypothetical protein
MKGVVALAGAFPTVMKPGNKTCFAQRATKPLRSAAGKRDGTGALG